MDEVERRDDHPSGWWLLETVNAVHRARSAADSPADFGTRLPETLVAPDVNHFAWIGQPVHASRTIEVLSSSEPLPKLLDVPGDDPLVTARAIEASECEITRNEAANPEYSHLVNSQEIPTADGAVAIPLGNDRVLHLYTNGSTEPPGTAETLATLRQSIGIEFERYTLESEIERERTRLEDLRSVISHDLGNPLNLAAGRLDLAQSECNSDHLENVEDALRQIEFLTDEALQFVQVGHEVDDRQPLSLAEIASESWAHIADDRGELTVEDTMVTADSERFRRVLNELFRNAFAHTDGEISVEVGPLPSVQGFFVADDGAGIPSDEREYVFDRGYTTDPDRDGNGLTIVREIAAAHHWTVSLEGDDGTRIEIQTGRW